MRNLEIIPIDLSEANAFVSKHHRHHKPVVGHKFSIGVVKYMNMQQHEIVGIAIVGRPVARFNDNGWTLEVTRVATDGTPNACSSLYGACRRAVFALGYKRLITYTLPQEGGSSLRGAGWKILGEAGGGTWDRKDRPRIDKHPTQKKFIWEAVA